MEDQENNWDPAAWLGSGFRSVKLVVLLTGAEICNQGLVVVVQAPAAQHLLGGKEEASREHHAWEIPWDRHLCQLPNTG